MDKTTFMSLDYIVFSSHKTMTQSLKETLNYNGFSCVHAHQPKHIDLTNKQIMDLSEEYYKHNNKNIKIISVYRDPMDRLISSFFQSLSVEKWGRTEYGISEKLVNFNESILFSEDFNSIMERFWYYCAIKTGVIESLDLICEIYDIQQNEISFQQEKIFTKNEFTNIDLFVSRFDILKDNFSEGVSAIIGRPVVEKIHNVARQKWYYKKYEEFRNNVQLPKVFIRNMYNSRRALIEIFYPGLFDTILNKTCERYGLRNAPK
ncbi:MAG: sulfotransferase domain-containing protein [Methylocystis sp.]